MKATLYKPLLLASVLLLLFTFSNVVSSSREPVTVIEPERSLVVTATESIIVTAPAYAVFDLKTGQQLTGENTTEVLPIASVTKLATAATVMQSFDTEAKVDILASDLLSEGRAGKLQAGEKYTYRELLFPLLLESSNDAASVFERVTEGKVVTAMNELATKVGMKDTHFTDASGLSAGNVSTIKDLISFAQYLTTAQPSVLDITQLKSYVGPYSGLLNNSPVIGPGYQGGKHGYTVAANRTLVAIFEEEISGESLAIGYVLLGSENMVSDIEVLRSFVRNSVRFE